jgi:hypothetical protein
MERDWLYIAEFAEAMEVHPDTVRRWIGMGNIETLGRVTWHSRVRIPKTELERLQSEPKNISHKLKRRSDEEIFKESNNIIGEKQLKEIVEGLKIGRLWISKSQAMNEYIEFFELDSNKYINPELNQLCTDFYNSLKSLYTFVRELFNRLGRRVVQDEWGRLVKIRRLEYQSDSMNNILEVLPEPCYDSGHILPEFGFAEEQHIEKLTEACVKAYQVYRTAVRQSLVL